jgi:hypothetical protein
MRLFFALAMLSASLAVAEEKPVEIPLKSIWALDMPGTRDINKLDEGKARKELIEPLLENIQEYWDRDDNRAMAVRGEGLQALQEFHRIKIKGADRQTVFKADDPISLVFYTKPTGAFVHLHSVVRNGNEYTISYKLVSHTEKIGSQHLALIPIGTISPGKYRVNIKPLPLEKDDHPDLLPLQAKRVCKSFSFAVTN